MIRAAVDRQSETAEGSKRVRKVAVRQLVANLAALSDSRDQTTAPEAGQVIGDVRTAGPERMGELGRVRRAVEQPCEDAPARAIGEGGTDPAEDVEVG